VAQSATDIVEQIRTVLRGSRLRNRRGRRYSFASRLVMAGVDIRTAAELSGHKPLAVTMRFAHLSADHQRAAVEQLEATTAAEQPPRPC
jgi:site-specific recombinase XerD